MLDVNLALLARLKKVALPEKGDAMDIRKIEEWLNALARYGYAPSEELFEAVLRNKTAADAILEAVKVHSLDHVDYKPLHGDFVKVMREDSDFEIYLAAILHYVSVYFDIPVDPKTDSTAQRLRSYSPLTILEGATQSDAAELAKTLIGQGQPFSDTDLEHVILFMDRVVPDSVEVPIHENLAHLAALDSKWADKMTTVTDVLRLAVALSGGHPSLAEDVKFKLSRPERRLIARTLENVLQFNGENYEDFTRFPEQWKRLAASAHLGDYGHDAVNRALSAIYDETARSFNSRYEAAKLQSPVEAAKVLSERPGDFARHLMELVRSTSGGYDFYRVLGLFKSVAPKVSLRVLIQLYDYVRGPRAHELPYTPLFTKNSAGGRIINKRDDSHEDYAKILEVIEYGFSDRLKDLTLNVDLDEAKQYAIPMGVRTASAANKLIGRGSRLKLADDAEFARLFMHWKNDHSRVDLDLSAVLMSEDFTHVESVWYGNLRNGRRTVYHSGDIVDAPDGAAEFIDVPLKVIDGLRYAVLSVNSFTGQYLSSVPEAWAGVMARSDVNSGENFEPSTVAMRGDLMTDSRQSVPLVLDLKEKEIIWVDRDVRGLPRGSNVLNSRPDLVVQDAILQPRMTVAELLELTGAHISESGEDLDPARSEQVLNLLN